MMTVTPLGCGSPMACTLGQPSRAALAMQVRRSSNLLWVAASCLCRIAHKVWAIAVAVVPQWHVPWNGLHAQRW